MNIAALLAWILQGTQTAVLTIEAVEGEAKSGASKKTMAQTALVGALNVALPGLSTSNAGLAATIAGAVNAGIDDAVALTKATGAYQKATAQAAANLTKATAPVQTAPVQTAAIAAGAGSNGGALPV